MISDRSRFNFVHVHCQLAAHRVEIRSRCCVWVLVGPLLAGDPPWNDFWVLYDEGGVEVHLKGHLVQECRHLDELLAALPDSLLRHV